VNFSSRTIAVLFLSCFACLAASAKSSEVSGPYANRLSAADVVAIKAAVSNARGISHTVKKIEAIRVDKVAVQTYTRTAVDEDTTYDFNVNKRSGTWTVDLNSVQVSIEKRDFRTHGPDIIR
jgi:hypothetical protein